MKLSHRDLQLAAFSSTVSPPMCQFLHAGLQDRSHLRLIHGLTSRRKWPPILRHRTEGYPSSLPSSEPLRNPPSFNFIRSIDIEMSRYLLLHLLLSSATSVTGLANCYLPNGTALPLSAAYQPCISTQNVFSMCCVLNTTALEAIGESAANLDTCLENGMCQPPAGIGGFTRDLCTDPTWKSPNCLNVCVGGTVSQ